VRKGWCLSRREIGRLTVAQRLDTGVEDAAGLRVRGTLTTDLETGQHDGLREVLPLANVVVIAAMLMGGDIPGWLLRRKPSESLWLAPNANASAIGRPLRWSRLATKLLFDAGRGAPISSRSAFQWQESIRFITHSDHVAGFLIRQDGRQADSANSHFGLSGQQAPRS
jgi:hypothetical protein